MRIMFEQMRLTVEIHQASYSIHGMENSRYSDVVQVHSHICRWLLHDIVAVIFRPNLNYRQRIEVLTCI